MAAGHAERLRGGGRSVFVPAAFWEPAPTPFFAASETINSGGGMDTVNCRHSGAVTLALDGCFDTGGAALADVVMGIENVRGQRRARTGAQAMRRPICCAAGLAMIRSGSRPWSKPRTSFRISVQRLAMTI